MKVRFHSIVCSLMFLVVVLLLSINLNRFPSTHEFSTPLEVQTGLPTRHHSWITRGTCPVFVAATAAIVMFLEKANIQIDAFESSGELIRPLGVNDLTMFYSDGKIGQTEATAPSDADLV